MLKDAKHDRRTVTVPVTTMEELPVLSHRELAALKRSLVEAEARIEAGDFVEYEPQTFKARLERSYKAAKRVKGA